MKIEEGKFYRTRSGEKRGPMQAVRHLTYPWCCYNPLFRSYAEDGCFYVDPNANSSDDLVAEWSEPVLSGPAVELSTLADMDAQPGDIVGRLRVGRLRVETSHGTPVCQVFRVLKDRHLQRTETGASHDFAFAWSTRPLFFMIHRAPRDAGSIDSSPTEFWETAVEEPEPDPDHEAENSRDALLDGPDWRKHCAALMDTVDALCTADDEHHRLRCFFRHVDAIGAARRDLEAGA